MEIKEFSAGQQVDVAVDLGAVPPSLPEILNLEQLCAVATLPPPVIIEGIDLVRWRDVHFLRARSKDGAEGLVDLREEHAALLARVVEGTGLDQAFEHALVDGAAVDAPGLRPGLLD